jgi:hypothetical protein
MGSTIQDPKWTRTNTPTCPTRAIAGEGVVVRGILHSTRARNGRIGIECRRKAHEERKKDVSNCQNNIVLTDIHSEYVEELYHNSREFYEAV